MPRPDRLPFATPTSTDLEGEKAQPGGTGLSGLPGDVGEGRGQDRCGHDRHSRSHACHRDPRRLAAQKHVFCQKPLTHTVWEARQVRLQAEKSGVITRMGNQIHSHGFYRTAVGLVQSGAIGKVRRVHSWINATGHGKSGQIGRVPLPRHQKVGVGPVAGGGAFAALREGKGLPSLGMAGLARFWERGSGRLRLPRFGSGFLGP